MANPIKVEIEYNDNDDNQRNDANDINDNPEEEPTNDEQDEIDNNNDNVNIKAEQVDDDDNNDDNNEDNNDDNNNDNAEEERADDEEDDDEDDHVKVTIDEDVPDYNLRAKQRQPQQAKPVSAIDLDAQQPILDVDINTIEDKPWRKPGADISDYFNYGFDEDTWKLYCEKQKKMKSIVEEVNCSTSETTFKIPVMPTNDHSKYSPARMIPTIVSNEPRFNAWVPPARPVAMSDRHSGHASGPPVDLYDREVEVRSDLRHRIDRLKEEREHVELDHHHHQSSHRSHSSSRSEKHHHSMSTSSDKHSSDRLDSSKHSSSSDRQKEHRSEKSSRDRTSDKRSHRDGSSKSSSRSSATNPERVHRSHRSDGTSSKKRDRSKDRAEDRGERDKRRKRTRD